MAKDNMVQPVHSCNTFCLVDPHHLQFCIMAKSGLPPLDQETWTRMCNPNRSNSDVHRVNVLWILSGIALSWGWKGSTKRMILPGFFSGLSSALVVVFLSVGSGSGSNDTAL